MLSRSLVRTLGNAFRARINECAELESLRHDPNGLQRWLRRHPDAQQALYRDVVAQGGARNGWIGTAAGRLWVELDLKGRTSDVETVEDEPPTAVSGLGGPRLLDAVALLGGERSLFELKKSDYPGYRSDHQRQAQIFTLGAGTYRAAALYRICADDKYVQVWTYEPARRAVARVLDRGSPWEPPLPDETISL
jgi:hypothetical protein